MRLSNIEFKAMNNPVRRFIQKHLEFRNFRWMGLTETDKDILEIGCGSGYGAVLLSTLNPRSYIGIDLMPEQIALTEKRDLPGYEFKTMDASYMTEIPPHSKDIIVIFGTLHHIPKWREVIRECRRVLRNSGSFFVEEPENTVIGDFDRFFNWEHEVSDFSLTGLEEELINNYFTIIRKRNILGFGTFHARKNPSTKEVLS